MGVWIVFCVVSYLVIVIVIGRSKRIRRRKGKKGIAATMIGKNIKRK